MMEKVEKILEGFDYELLLAFSEKDGEYLFSNNLSPTLIKLIDYLVKRCELAEKYIDESISFGDTTEAFEKWQDFIEEKL